MLGAAMMELSTYIRDIMDNKEKNMGDIVKIIDYREEKNMGDIVNNMDRDRLASQYWC